MIRKEYYVQSTKYQLLKLIRETPQLDLDQCLTSSLMQFVAYFKCKIIEAYTTVCNIRNCYVCQTGNSIAYTYSKVEYLGIGFVKNICLMISGYNLEMLDKHCTTMSLNVNYIM